VHRRGQRIHYVTPGLEPGIQKTLDCRVKPGSSERLLMRQLDYNLLFRWFVGLGIDDPVWHPTAFTTYRERLLAGEVATRLLAAVLNHPQVRGLLSREHFTVDGTLVEAWASLKSFRPKDERDDPPDGGRNTSRDFHGEGRTNDGHASTTDPDARLFRKGRGKEARLCFMGHVLMENRHALVVEAELTRAAGSPSAGRRSSWSARGPGWGRSRSAPIGPTIPPIWSWSCASSEPRRTSPRTPGPALGDRSPHHLARRLPAEQRAQHRIEEVFAWVKTIAGQSKTKHRGLDRVRWHFTLAAAAYNLIRLPKLLGALP
jgi:Transposase domain (DUF772)/Transposase DDE domain